ncbi:MAG TPA: PAS domain S-box protein [Longimicrobiaceae bacterium]|nr:PAS domain S-box protein [Longimicrobiaceae bacterium]
MSTPLPPVAVAVDPGPSAAAEEALRASEESYRAIFDASHDAIFVTDPETGRVVDANRRACEMCSSTLEELRRDAASVIWNGPPPYTAEAAREQTRRAAAGEVQRFDWMSLHPRTGEEIWGEVSLQRITLGGEARVLALVRDIRERRETERRLRESEESYRAIFAHASDAIWVHDLETGEALDVNLAAAEMYGYTLEEMREVPHSALLYPDSEYTAERVAEYLGRAAAGETPRFEWMGRRRDGSPVWGEVRLRRVTINGQDRILASARDIGDRKRAEELLRRQNEELEARVEERTAELARARDEAERANRAKSEFLSRMSHELRTPLNSILGFAQVLDRAGLPPEQGRSLQHILKAGRHLLQLINDVLEIARIEAGRQSLSLEPVRIGGAAQEAAALVRPLAEQWRVRVEEDCRALAGAYVRADRQRLTQVLLNLLSNAIKYNRPGGRVRITCASGGAAAGGTPLLALRVEDTGRGIPAEQVEQLFTPFARLGAEQTEVEGTGLGLALSQRLTEAMGGSLALERTGPEGSVFRLELRAADDPLERVEEARGALVSVPAPPHRPATLLYVEDNLANLSLVETILLSRPGWRVVPALQGQLGLELAREHRPDLVLLDLHLPDVSGEEVLRRLRADERTCAIPVVVVSADATHSRVDRLRASGADAYLTKPLDIDEFLDTVQRFLPDAEPGAGR